MNAFESEEWRPIWEFLNAALLVGPDFDARSVICHGIFLFAGVVAIML
jgi:hypothetical protein